MKSSRSRAILVGLGLLGMVGGALAAPAYQMPFACNETWTLATYVNHDQKYAVDFNRAGDEGDPIVASAAGTVVLRKDWTTSYGKHILIDHGNDHKTLYAHLASFSVSLGQSVRQGQKIGTLGSTGNSSGPHLHYDQRVGTAAKPVVFNGVAVPYFDTVTRTSRNQCGSGGVTGVVDTTGAPLNVRGGPGTGYDVVWQVADGATVTIYCQMPGTTVSGPFGTSNIWDRIGTGRYLSDAYVRTGSDGYVAPRCE